MPFQKRAMQVKPISRPQRDDWVASGSGPGHISNSGRTSRTGSSGPNGETPDADWLLIRARRPALRRATTSIAQPAAKKATGTAAMNAWGVRPRTSTASFARSGCTQHGTSAPTGWARTISALAARPELEPPKKL